MPVFVVVYFSGMEHAAVAAAGIYVIAAITDVLDGAIARKYNMISSLGRILDPLGDKLMTFAALVSITVDKVIPLWAVIVFFVKESLMAIGGLIVHKKLTDVPSSNYFGKFSTAVFFTVCVILMVFRNIPANTATWMIAFAILIMIVAFLSYLITFIKVMRSSGTTGAKE